jgi:hypothetical protein
MSLLTELKMFFDCGLQRCRAYVAIAGFSATAVSISIYPCPSVVKYIQPAIDPGCFKALMKFVIAGVSFRFFR